MDLNKLQQQITDALKALGLTEIELDFKPRNTPGPHVKIFISCETPQPKG